MQERDWIHERDFLLYRSGTRDHMNGPPDALSQNFMKSSASSNRRAARVIDKKSFKLHLLLNN